MNNQQLSTGNLAGTEESMSAPGKPGSSRRKGDEYQDLISLRLVLDNYIRQQPFEIFLEYEKSGNLDDIIIFYENDILAYQVKYATNHLDVYQKDDFTDNESPVYFKKFADGWSILRERFPNKKLVIHLLSNRGLDASLIDIVDSNGKFSNNFINDKKRKEAKSFRSDLKNITGLNDEDFSTFLSSFVFLLKEPTLNELETFIRVFQLDNKLGLNDPSIFLELKSFMKDVALFSRTPIVNQDISERMRGFQSKLLLPQIFPVCKDSYVERYTLSEKLRQVLNQVANGYIIITGLPGSGKSTSLTTFFDQLDHSQYEVLKYYCFVDINDNAQKIRVQAKSLCANILEEFHRRYPTILDKRFNYSEENFLQGLDDISDYFMAHERRLIIFIDGLDHAERLGEDIRDTITSVLPKELPPNITIVIGTQELHFWPSFLKQTYECPERHIVMPLFSEDDTHEYLREKRKIFWLSRADVSKIYRKSEGLPLYLQYVAERLIEEGDPIDVARLPAAKAGNIRNYYRVLWDEFVNQNMTNSMHICLILSCTHFTISRAELCRITEFKRPDFEAALKFIKHLLRDSGGQLKIFHNSFREFLKDEVETDWLNDIKKSICSFLKAEKNSPRWFSHVFQYCAEIEDHAYIIDEINSNFVNNALFHCRPFDEIISAIETAIESAYQQQDIVQVSRLGSLKYITNDRLENNIDRGLLANALLSMGKTQDVISFAFSPEMDHWLVNDAIALEIMISMAEKNKIELGGKLFNIFIKEFKGFSTHTHETKKRVISLAKCLGIYSNKLAGPLRWLSQFNFSQDTLETVDDLAPEYTPHLASYIDVVVNFNYTEKWQRLKRIKKLFPRDSVFFFLLRAFACYGKHEDLKITLHEYLAQKTVSENIELAYYAAMTGEPKLLVKELAGTIIAPALIAPTHLLRNDSSLIHYTYSFIVLAYDDDKLTYDNLVQTVGCEDTLWNAILRHLLNACYCIGTSFKKSSEDWYGNALESINVLINAKQGNGERICDSIDIIRKQLPFTIVALTEEIRKKYPDRIDAWFKHLIQLRESLLWTTHFGITEYIEDYGFEFALWQKFAKYPQYRNFLIPILHQCAETYKKSTFLKGESKAAHFMHLAVIMAQCGRHDDASATLHHGIEASLIYGYHKDVTLSYLIDMLKLVNEHNSSKALERCARVLAMVKWMPHLTDGRETKWFTEMAFNAVLEINRPAALELLSQLSQTSAKWKVQNCLEKYILSEKSIDPEYLWCLSETLANHNTQDGVYCNQIMRIKEYIVKLSQNYSDDIYEEFERRYKNFIFTTITPRHWSQKLQEEFFIVGENKVTPDHFIEKPSSREFLLDEETVSRETIINICQESFLKFIMIMDKLKKQNEYFYDDISDKIVLHHITIADSIDELCHIGNYLKNNGRIQNIMNIESLAMKLIDYGYHEEALEFLELAYSSLGEFCRWKHNSKYIVSIAECNKTRAKKCVLKECLESTHGDWGGYDTPSIAAFGLAALKENSVSDVIFEDYLKHCESMFSQLPSSDDFQWLSEYRQTSKYLNKLIFDFVVNELSTREIDLGKRLVIAISKLMIKQPECISWLIPHLETSTGCALRRILTIFHCATLKNPNIFIVYQKDFVKLLSKPDFLVRQVIIRILNCINTVSPVTLEIREAIDRIERNYSNVIGYPSYRLPLAPSPEFNNFVQRYALFSFCHQLESISQVTKIPIIQIIAAIESYLLNRNWSIDFELESMTAAWESATHPQGWPIVWIITEFQEKLEDALGEILNELVEKLQLNDVQVNLLWQTIQPDDYEYIFQEKKARPQDINRLNVQNREEWFNALKNRDRLVIVNKNSNEEWITICEEQRLSQDKTHSIPFKQGTLQTGFLIPRKLYGGVYELENQDEYVENVNYRFPIAITAEELRTELIRRSDKSWDFQEDPMPLIAKHQNPSSFLGYQTICSLASFIIKDFHLTFDGMNLIRDKEIVATYEAWQEGYQGDAHTRDLLAFGYRLRVHRSLLKDICQYYNRVLCIHLVTVRESYESMYQKAPTDMLESSQYILHYF